jgi:hypothetical protein
MSSTEINVASRRGFIVRLVGILAVAGGFIAYSLLLRKMQSGPVTSGGAFGSATPLMIASATVNLGAVVLMAGLVSLQDRATLRLAGLALGILLIMLDMPTLNALTSPQAAKVIAVLIGIAFILVPWFIRPKAVKKPVETDQS